MFTNVDAMTIFNGRTDKETRRKIYTPTVIYDLAYAEAKGATVANNGVWSEDVQYKIRIPLTAKIQGKRVFLPDLHYAKLKEEEIMNHWTISKGDLIVRDEYIGGKLQLYEDELIAYAKEQGLDLIHVTEHADNTFGGSEYTKHWRIGGK
ncbi:MAG: hypothetical protein HFF79_08155 [Oscillospiraceae bacterium]|nr:hypothetical protein [Oscillospiraceae bacterium]